jgi:hypothetical protein
MIAAAPERLADDFLDAVVTMANVERTRIEWLWPGFVPIGKLTILDGDPGLGKSTLTLDLAARGSRGDSSPAGDPMPRFHTIILSTEDDAEDTIGPRLDAAKADSAYVYVVRDLTIPEDVEKLRRLVRVCGRGTLIILDPLVGYLSGKVNMNDDHEVRRAFAPFVQMLAEEHAACIGLRHLSKAGERKAIYRGGGSIGIAGLARSVLAVGPDPDDDNRVVLTVVKSNLARKPRSLAYRIASTGPYDPSWIEWLGETDHSAEAIIGKDADLAEGQSRVSKLADEINRIVNENGGRMRAADAHYALEEAGLIQQGENSSILTRAKRKAGIRSARETFDGPWYWEVAA